MVKDNSEFSLILVNILDVMEIIIPLGTNTISPGSTVNVSCPAPGLKMVMRALPRPNSSQVQRHLDASEALVHLPSPSVASKLPCLSVLGNY